MLQDDVARDLGPVRAVEARINQYFKAIGCLLGQHDGEGLGSLGGGRLSHALLLQCLGNACKVILVTGVGGGSRQLPMESSMSKTANRQPLTVRLDPESKKLFAEEAEKCGLEAGVAARQILELYVQRLRESGDYIQTLSDFSQALKTRAA